MDLDSGMVRFLTKTKSAYSVLDAVNNLHRLDTEFLEGAGLERHSAGRNRLRARPALAAAAAAAEQMRQVLRFVRPNYDWTMVDLGRSLSCLAMARWKRSTKPAW